MHGIHALQPFVDGIRTAATAVSGIGPILGMLAPWVANAALGLVVGALVLALVSAGRRLAATSATG